MALYIEGTYVTQYKEGNEELAHIPAEEMQNVFPMKKPFNYSPLKLLS